MFNSLQVLALLLLCLFQTKLSADEVSPKINSPRATMETFLVSMNELKKSERPTNSYLNEAALTFDLSDVDESLRSISGRQYAKKLIHILDRIENVDLFKIPNYETGKKWFFRKESIEVNDKKVDVEISIDKNKDGGWRFTPETIASINSYYQYTSMRPLARGVRVDENNITNIKHFMATWGQEKVFYLTRALWLGFGVIVVLSLMVFYFVRELISFYLLRLSKKKAFLFSKEQITKISLPFAVLAFSIVWLSGINIIELGVETYAKIARLIYILLSLTSVWAAIKLVDLFTTHFEKIAFKTATKFDDTLVPMISKSVKFLIFTFGFVLVAHTLTFDIRGILAGVGIGGIAVALAAKDTIANFFGSVTVILDRPFQIGDHIFLNKSIEGVVENIGFRSTRIRTFENSLVTIPNSVLANMSVDNYGERFSRRFKVDLEVDLKSKTSDLDKFCEELRAYCLSNKLINDKNLSVFINDIKNKVISIQVIFYILTRDLDVEYEQRHLAFKEMLRLAEDNNIEFVKVSKAMFLKEVKDPGQDIPNA